MKPYDDPSCPCHTIVKGIDKRYPKADWNMDEACEAWGELSRGLVDNHIEFEDSSDEEYSCTCPTCGATICGWCV